MANQYDVVDDTPSDDEGGEDGDQEPAPRRVVVRHAIIGCVGGFAVWFALFAVVFYVTRLTRALMAEGRPLAEGRARISHPLLPELIAFAFLPVLVAIGATLRVEYVTDIARGKFTFDQREMIGPYCRRSRRCKSPDGLKLRLRKPRPVEVDEHRKWNWRYLLIACVLMGGFPLQRC